MDLSAYVLGNRGSIALTMGSFKLRLVIYFMLLALLPLVAATGSVVFRSTAAATIAHAAANIPRRFIERSGAGCSESFCTLSVVIRPPVLPAGQF